MHFADIIQITQHLDGPNNTLDEQTEKRGKERKKGSQDFAQAGMNKRRPTQVSERLS